MNTARFKPHTRRSQKQRGTVLVQVALFLTVWAALAALSVDLARVRGAREAMQNALDHAALEGLRGRDSLGEQDRRGAAARAIRLAFDADLVEAGPDVGPPLGAGAVVPVGELAGVPGAGGIEPETIAFWQPVPELNLPNAGFGDLVAGSFQSGLGSLPEATDYSRADFTPAVLGTADQAPAFLARLRRTRPDQPLDRLPAISSAGPTLSLLFGFGALLQPTPGSGFDVKRDGITVRATAIANSTNALAAALGPPGQGLLQVSTGDGALPQNALVPAIDFPRWQGLATGETLSFVLNDDGTLADSVSGDLIGRVWLAAGALAVAQASAIDELPSPASLGLSTDPSDAPVGAASPRAIAIQRADGSNQVEIVGFAAAQVEAQAGAQPVWNLIKLPPSLAPDRVSAHVPAAWLALEPGGPLARPDLAADHTSLTGALLAPVLAR